MNKTEAIQVLFKSTKDFHNRFNTPKNLWSRIRAMWEEVCEYIVEEEGTFKKSEEATDVLVTCMGIMLITDEEINWEDSGKPYNPGYVSSNLLINFRKGKELKVRDIIDSVYADVTVESILHVAEKNNKKTLETHKLNKNGQVKRI